MMKVLLFSNLFPNPVEPERGVFTYQLVKALAKKCEVIVVCPLPWFPKSKAFKFLTKWHQASQVPNEYNYQGITVYAPKYILLPKISKYLHPWFLRVGVRRYIKRVLGKYEFDVINSHWLYPDSIAIASIAKEEGMPHVATALGCDVNRAFNDSLMLKQLQKAFKDIDGFTSVSTEMKNKIVSSGVDEDKTRAILNGVDQDLFSIQNKLECRAQLNLNSSDKTFLYIGRLSEEKGVSFLLDGFAAAVREQNVGVLYIVGDGDLREEMELQVKALGMKEHIIFVGGVAHQEIRSWLGAADFLCLPSKREGCPNVILESISTGTPVLASRVGAIPDLVDENNGVLFDAESSDSITLVIQEALNMNWDEVLVRKSINGLTWDRIAEQYIDAYRAAIMFKNEKEKTSNICS